MNLPSNFACYVINLDRSPDRLALMTARLQAMGMPFERVCGVDGMTLSEAEFQSATRVNRFYKPMRRGEVGCYMGHNAAKRRFLESDKEYALILEDDAVFSDDFVQVIAKALALRNTLSNPLAHWDVLKLMWPKKRFIELARIDDSHLLVEYGPSVPIAATAAIWTREGAQKWLSKYKGTARPIDCDLQFPWEYDLTIRSIHPPVAVAQGQSVIGTAERRLRSNSLRKINYEVSRIWPKLSHFGRSYGWLFMLRWIFTRHLRYPLQ